MQYIRSYVEDLNTDIHQLDSMVNHCKERNAMVDSLTDLLDSPDRSSHGSDIYYFSRLLTLNFPFFSTDRTIQQLKNGGNLRLISKQTVSDAMMNYDRQIRWLENIREREEYYVRDYVSSLEKICDPRIFRKMTVAGFGFVRPAGNPTLLNDDKLTILEFIGKLHFMRSANSYLMINYQKTIEAAKQDLEIIKKDYRLK